MADVLMRMAYLKFSQNQDERNWLLSTGQLELVDASVDHDNGIDRNLGIGFRANAAEENRNEWGQHVHGKVVMHARERIRQEMNRIPIHSRSRTLGLTLLALRRYRAKSFASNDELWGSDNEAGSASNISK